MTLNPMNPLELLSWLLIEECKKEVMNVVLDLVRLDQRLGDLALGLPLPPEMTTRWNPEDPLTVAVNLQTVISVVRSNELQRAMRSLRWAAQQSPLSLWLASGQE